jgi:uncharacterized RmlC-like cupin family protein
MANANPNWKDHGIRIVRAFELDANTPQTAGMTRAAAITHASAGASKLWAGTVVVEPNVRTGPLSLGRSLGVRRGGWPR